MQDSKIKYQSLNMHYFSKCKIGFSTGSCYRLFENTFSSDSISTIGCISSHAIELLVHNLDEFEMLLSVPVEVLDKFSYVSIHSPSKIVYGRNQESGLVLDNLRKAVERYGVETVVLHPTSVEDWSIFENCKDIPFAIENMDERKPFGQIPEDIEKWIRDYDLNFVLDLQHIYVNDPSMKIADRFIDKFINRLVEIHISAYDEKWIHYMLSRKSQNVIVGKLKEILEMKDVPVIIESTLETKDDLLKEFTYINNFFE